MLRSLLAHALAPSLLVASVVAGASAAHADPIVWSHQHLDAALEEAASCGGHVLVDVYATWCGPCQRLAREVFPDPSVEHAARGMIAIKIDAERDEGPEIRQRYHVVGYPTVLVLDAQGREIDRIFGFEPADEFARHLESIRFGPTSFGEIVTRFVDAGTAENVLAAGFEAGFDAAACGNYEHADALLRAVVAADPDNSAGFGAQALLVLGKYRHLRGAEEYDEAIALFAELRTRFPDTAEADQALVQTAIAHARAGRTESALAAFDTYLQVDPTDGDRANAVAFTMFLERVALDRAESIARAALDADPDDASLWDTLAEVQYARGDADGARTSIARAIALEPESAYYAEQADKFSTD